MGTISEEILAGAPEEEAREGNRRRQRWELNFYRTEQGTDRAS